MTEIVKRAQIKAGMIRMCEPIAFGSDADLLDECADEIERLKAEVERLRTGHQGACYACELVGELNIRLNAEVERMREALGEAVMLLDNNQNNNPPHMQKYLAKWEAALNPSQEPRT
jgi:hypothetical protein